MTIWQPDYLSATVAKSHFARVIKAITQLNTILAPISVAQSRIISTIVEANFHEVIAES